MLLLKLGHNRYGQPFLPTFVATIFVTTCLVTPISAQNDKSTTTQTGSSSTTTSTTGGTTLGGGQTANGNGSILQGPTNETATTTPSSSSNATTTTSTGGGGVPRNCPAVKECPVGCFLFEGEPPSTTIGTETPTFGSGDGSTTAATVTGNGTVETTTGEISGGTGSTASGTTATGAATTGLGGTETGATVPPDSTMTATEVTTPGQTTETGVTVPPDSTMTDTEVTTPGQTTAEIGTSTAQSTKVEDTSSTGPPDTNTATTEVTATVTPTAAAETETIPAEETTVKGSNTTATALATTKNEEEAARRRRRRQAAEETTTATMPPQHESTDACKACKCPEHELRTPTKSICKLPTTVLWETLDRIKECDQADIDGFSSADGKWGISVGVDRAKLARYKFGIAVPMDSGNSDLEVILHVGSSGMKSSDGYVAYQQPLASFLMAQMEMVSDTLYVNITRRPGDEAAQTVMYEVKDVDSYVEHNQTQVQISHVKSTANESYYTVTIGDYRFNSPKAPMVEALSPKIYTFCETIPAMLYKMNDSSNCEIITMGPLLVEFMYGVGPSQRSIHNHRCLTPCNVSADGRFYYCLSQAWFLELLDNARWMDWDLCGMLMQDDTVRTAHGFTCKDANACSAQNEGDPFVCEVDLASVDTNPLKNPITILCDLEGKGGQCPGGDAGKQQLFDYCNHKSHIPQLPEEEKGKLA